MNRSVHKPLTDLFDAWTAGKLAAVSLQLTIGLRRFRSWALIAES
jgi:hypothetical protein